MDSYPRQSALTGGFRHGQPRSFRITDTAVYFLRSDGPRDPHLKLHRWDRATGGQGIILRGTDDTLTDTEKSMRERLRETAAGITAYDVAGDRVVANAAGTLLTWDPNNGARAVTRGGFDPRISPDGQWLAWVAGGRLHVRSWDGEQTRTLVRDEGTVSWAVADFIAAEEFSRSRGYWWLPDSSGLLVQRTDESAVPVWHRGDPNHPEAPVVSARYPAAGATNAVVELWRIGLDGARTRIDLPEHEYLAGAGRLISTFNREQTELTISGHHGEVRTVLRQEPWLDLVPGLPREDDGGRLLAWTDQRRRRLTIDGVPASPPDVQLRAVAGTIGDVVYVTASSTAAESRLARIDSDGFTWLSEPDCYTTATVESGLVVTHTARWDAYRAEVIVHDADHEALLRVENLAEEPVVKAAPTLIESGADEVQTVVLMPTDEPDRPLPILMSPYGGPHAQRVLAARGAFASGQWLADQGFCVVIADGRGTPGQSPAWEHAVNRDLRGPALDDQIRALDSVGRRLGDRVDTSRVGIMGWSYGGYLAALAVLARPDVFGAAVAGAPVTDWRLYDTAYTERYLGNPTIDDDPYEQCSLIPLASQLRRPLMLIHGLADDNVYAAHTLRLSEALLAAGRPHEVLPLSGVTHMTPQPEVAENLLLLQVDFLRRHLS